MKLLVATTAKTTQSATMPLAWAGRAGYAVRLFVPKGKASRYYKVIEDINHDEYLDLKYDMVVDRTDPKNYAEQHGFDLLVTIPNGLKAWKLKAPDYGVGLFVIAISKARLEFNQNPNKRIKRWANGSVMQRIKL